MNIREMPQLEMPREKLLRYGKENLSTAELLAILLRTGSRSKSAVNLAYELLAMDSRGLRYIAECTPEELACINGVGTVKACQILAAIELGRRIAAAPQDKNTTIRSSGDIADLFMEKLRYEKKEHFYCIMMNTKGEIIEEREVSVGDLNSSQVHPREVLRDGAQIGVVGEARLFVQQGLFVLGVFFEVHGDSFRRLLARPRQHRRERAIRDRDYREF